MSLFIVCTVKLHLIVMLRVSSSNNFERGGDAYELHELEAMQKGGRGCGWGIFPLSIYATCGNLNLQVCLIILGVFAYNTVHIYWANQNY